MSDMDTEALRTIADEVVAIRAMLERQAYPAVTVGAESALLDDSPPCAESGPHCGHWRDGKDICCACGAVVATDPTPTVPHGLASPAAPTVALSMSKPVDLGSLGLGAVVLEYLSHSSPPTTWVRAAIAGEPAWVAAYPSIEGVSAVRAITTSLGCDDAALQVLHPGITLAGEGS